VSSPVWITRAGASVGVSWDLIGGIVRNPFVFDNATGQYAWIAEAASPYWQTSFSPRFEAAQCEDPTGDAAYILSGHTRNDVWLDDGWRTTDGRQWSSVGMIESGARSQSSCVVLHDSSIVVTGGVDHPYATRTGYTLYPFNDVWRSTQAATDWKVQTTAAPFPARAKALMLATLTPLIKDRDIIYVMGGNSEQPGNLFYNDVVWSIGTYPIHTPHTYPIHAYSPYSPSSTLPPSLSVGVV
jgi:hypothetical protein